ncbi:MAG: serine/threonine protein kinase [Myxococcales bacterium]|nr:serine/threonine protein kinase [Myxococcales bacterium]
MAKRPTKKGDPLIGAVIDRRWEVLDQLGAGGMGIVYRAERINLGKQVAIKFLHQSVAESKMAVARFEREAKAISRLHHVNCISILDFGVYRKQPYIVQEFVHGRQLTELDLPTLTASRSVALVRQVLLGLQHAHSRGVIHRDLKLSNVMLVEMTGTENLVKLLDFGLARISGVNEELSLTEGMVAGTPSYMPPEQALGKKTDHRSDIYSAGVVLYVLATGQRPFSAEGTTALLRMQVDDTPPSPRRVAPQKRISEALERVILRALEKKPADRFQSVTEFLAALDDTPEGQETLTPTVMRERHKLQGWRWRMMGIAAAACVALGAAGALWARAHYQRLRSQAVGTYERWTGSTAAPPKPALPAPAPRETKAVVPPLAPAAAPPLALDAAVAPEPATKSEPARSESATSEPAPGGELPDPPKPDAPLPRQEPTTPARPSMATPPTPTPMVTPAHARTAPATPTPTPTPSDVREWRHHVDALIADGKINPAKNQLRDRIAVDKTDAWAHLRLGNLYADAFHYRRDAFREWQSAFAVEPALKSDVAFRKSVCETVDASDRVGVAEFLRAQIGVAETPTLLVACIRAAGDPNRIENAAQVIESVAGAERPELGIAALRMLDVGKTCAQKKAAVEVIRRLRYMRARATLIKLDRQRLAHQSHEPATLECFGTTIAEAIEQLK